VFLGEEEENSILHYSDAASSIPITTKKGVEQRLLYLYTFVYVNMDIWYS